MSRSKLVIPFFRILLTRPGILLKSLFHGVNNFLMHEKVARNYNLPNGFPCVDILDLLPDFNVQISNYSFLNGTSTPIDIALLKALAASFKDCSYLEIGSWRGESIANVADVAKDCTSISLSDSEMHALGFNERFTSMQRFFSKEKKNIEYIQHNSLTFDFSKLNKKFDLIFVDGDHAYEAVKKDTENVFGLLKDENSIIVWHDYAAAFEMPAWHVAAAIWDGTPADKRKNLYCVSNTLCAIYTTKKVKTSVLDYPTRPDKKFEVAIKATAIGK